MHSDAVIPLLAHFGHLKFAENEAFVHSSDTENVRQTVAQKKHGVQQNEQIIKQFS